MAVNVTDVSVYAEDLIKISFSGNVRNNDALKNTTNYSIIGGTFPVTVHDVIVKDNDAAVSEIYLYVLRLFQGVEYSLTVESTTGIVDSGGTAIDSGVSTFLGIDTKVTRVLENYPSPYDTSIDSRVRGILTAIHREDDLISSTDIQNFVYTPLAIVTESQWKLLETFVVSGASTATFDFDSTLNGDVDQSYLIRYHIIQSGSNSGQLLLRVNGITLNSSDGQLSTQRFNPAITFNAIAGSVGLQGQISNLETYRGEFEFRADSSPAGVAVDRAGLHYGSQADPTVSVGNDAQLLSGHGFWDDNVTNVTALGLAMNNGNEFDVGTVIELWKLVF